MNLTLEYEDNKKQEIPSDTSCPHCGGEQMFSNERSNCKEKAVFVKTPRYVWTRPKIQGENMTWLWNWHTLTCAGVNSTPLSVEPTPFVSSFAAHVWCFLFFSRPSGSSIDLNCLSRRTRETPAAHVFTSSALRWIRQHVCLTCELPLSGFVTTDESLLHLPHYLPSGQQ